MIENILLVEDNDDDAFAFRWALKKCPVSVQLNVVTDGLQAKNYLAGEGKFRDREEWPLPDLVFLDLKLPYYSGHEVLEWIRSQPELASLCVVILSGSDEAGDHQRAEANGVKRYLIKPPTAQDLGEAIAWSLPQSSSR